MKERIEFRNAVNAALAGIDPEVLSYDENEFWMIQSPYTYVEHYALSRGLWNTSIALPLARGLHDGVHRKSSLVKNGVRYRLPYVYHCLLVCRMLQDLHLPLPKEEEDVVLAAALCHDMIEDVEFKQGGTELTDVYHLDPRVYETVKLVSKRRDFTREEEEAHFQKIQENKLALLVKLSDRSHNVEDLYNMSAWKVHEYVGETRTYMIPMCRYGLEHYPELAKPLSILYDKLVGLTRAAEILVDRCEAREQELTRRLEELQQENEQLREQYRALWEA